MVSVKDLSVSEKPKSSTLPVGKERVLFKMQIMVEAEPEEIEKIENKLLNLTKKKEVVDSHISKFYQ